MDMSSPVFSLNLGTPLSAQADNVEEQHLEQLARQIQPSPLQPQQHDSPLHQSPQTALRNASGMQPYAASSGLTPQSLMQPQTPAGHVHASSGATPTGGSTPHSSVFPSTPGPPMTPITPASADPGIVPQLQNIVSTVNLGCKLDLKKIALHARNAEYNPKRFAAVIMRIREPRTTALIFSSGKMVCTGAKSEEQSRLAARKYARIIQKLGFD
ncbi:unnamed protein product, partial [Ixodes hexagonus]